MLCPHHFGAKIHGLLLMLLKQEDFALPPKMVKDSI